MPARGGKGMQKLRTTSSPWETTGRAAAAAASSVAAAGRIEIDSRMDSCAKNFKPFYNVPPDEICTAFVRSRWTGALGCGGKAPKAKENAYTYAYTRAHNINRKCSMRIHIYFIDIRTPRARARVRYKININETVILCVRTPATYT
jgi:hypothetical protein